MGDPILPNPGTEMVAAAVKATHVGVVLAPVQGLALANEARGTSAFTQFRTTGDALAVHGFGAGSSPAGEAAREQIRGFLDSALAGDPVVTVPQGCVDNGGSCDFTGVQ